MASKIDRAQIVLILGAAANWLLAAL